MLTVLNSKGARTGIENLCSRLIPYLSQDHWYSTRRDLAWSPSPREIDSHREFLPFSNNCANSCCLLTKLFAYCPVAHPSLVQVYNIVPSVLGRLFGLAHMDRLNSDWLSVWTGVFYTGNEFKQVWLLKDKLTGLWEPEMVGRWSNTYFMQ